MQATHLWHKFHIRWYQIVFLGAFLISSYSALGQNTRRNTENLINYDEERIHYGFVFGLHSSRYIIKYNEAFVSPAFDSLQSVVNKGLAGFKVGFVINVRLFQYLDFRVLPTFGLYENELDYRFTNSSTLTLFRDATYFELPLLLKYKSVRRRNTAVYLVAGINPSLEAAARGDESADVETLELRNWNIAVETGIGLDIYFPLFKFSPEIRYSWGFRNLLVEEVNQFNAPLDKLIFHNFTFYISFEGGPSYLKKNNRRR